MKRLFPLLLILLAMTASFVVIGLIVLFATGTVNTLQDVTDLLTGKKPSETTRLTKNPPEHMQDAVQALTQHKNELQQDISQLQENATELKEQREKLQEELDKLQDQQGDQSTENAQQRASRKDAVVTLFNKMRPADAAAVMDNLSDELVLELLMGMDDRQGARILTALADDQRKATLIEKFLQNKN